MTLGRQAALAAVIAAGALFGTQSAASESRAVKLVYDVYVGGVRAIAIDVDIALAADTYEVRLKGGAEGLVARMIDWGMTSRAKGRFVDGAARPDEAGHVSRWNRKERLIGLRYAADGTVEIVKADPPLERDATDPGAEARRRNTTDLASAVLSLVKGVERGERCTGTLPIFDGRKRYDLLAEDLGEDVIRRSRHGAYAGRADTCQLSWRPYRDDGTPDQPADGGPRTGAMQAWVAPVLRDLPPVPVLLAMEMRIGHARAYLVRGEVSDGAGTRRIEIAEIPAD